MTKQFLSIKRTAQRLDIAEPTVRRWIAEGKLTAVRIGARSIRVQADSVAQLVSPRTVIK